MLFNAWFERHGAGLDRAAAFAAWNAAIEAAFETALERSETKRKRVSADIPEFDQEHAAAGFLESRHVASLVYSLKASR